VKDGAYRHKYFVIYIIPYKHIFWWYFLGFVESGNWIESMGWFMGNIYRKLVLYHPNVVTMG